MSTEYYLKEFAGQIEEAEGWLDDALVNLAEEHKRPEVADVLAKLRRLRRELHETWQPLQPMIAVEQYAYDEEAKHEP